MPSASWQTLSTLNEATLYLHPVAAADPFLNPRFLQGLESTGCVGPGTGWQPRHLLLEQDSRSALLPLYMKTDSRGEYVFDHAWAAAYQRHGLRYFPKLVTAIPFTPVPGPRLLLAEGDQPRHWLPDLFTAVQDYAEQEAISGWHALFVPDDWLPDATHAGMLIRTGCRFHWQNPSYRDFSDFLDTLTSKKRKDIRRERRLLADQGVRSRRLGGTDITPADAAFFFACYERTYLEHGQAPYLNLAFFQHLFALMPENIVLVIAEDASGPMASALFLHDDRTLYGRYWGCLRRADGLHFELCYYQGMEICTALGLTDFDPGTQGEHKLLRGFAPRLTHSLHWLREPAFHDAISRFVEEEKMQVQQYCEDAANYLPYRKNG